MVECVVVVDGVAAEDVVFEFVSVAGGATLGATAAASSATGAGSGSGGGGAVCAAGDDYGLELLGAGMEEVSDPVVFEAPEDEDQHEDDDEQDGEADDDGEQDGDADGSGDGDGGGSEDGDGSGDGDGSADGDGDGEAGPRVVQRRPVLRLVLCDDDVAEANETVLLRWRASGAAPASGLATVVVVDDDSPPPAPTPVASRSAATTTAAPAPSTTVRAGPREVVADCRPNPVVEPGAGAAPPSNYVSCDFRLTSAVPSPVTVRWRTREGTAKKAAACKDAATAAKDGGDYTETAAKAQGSRTLVFAAGDLGPKRRLVARICDDGWSEPDEAFTLHWSAANAAVSTSPLTVTVYDDDSTRKVRYNKFWIFYGEQSGQNSPTGHSLQCRLYSGQFLLEGCLSRHSGFANNVPGYHGTRRGVKLTVWTAPMSWDEVDPVDDLYPATGGKECGLPGVDYEHIPPNKLVIPAWHTLKEINVMICKDSIPEHKEGFYLHWRFTAGAEGSGFKRVVIPSHWLRQKCPSGQNHVLPTRLNPEHDFHAPIGFGNYFFVWGSRVACWKPLPACWSYKATEAERQFECYKRMVAFYSNPAANTIHVEPPPKPKPPT